MPETFTIDPISVFIGLGAGFIIGAAIIMLRVLTLEKQKAGMEARLESERSSMEAHFQTLAQQALKNNSENFLTIAQEKLKNTQADSRHDLDKRTQAIAEMVKPVEKHLSQLGSAVEQLQGTDKAIREDLQNLGKETARLTGALKNPAAQGKWGEFVLERLLDKANLIKGVHYQSQVHLETAEGTLRPDVVITLQDGFNIVVDAKAPITPFINQLEDDQDTQSRADLQINLAKAVRSHIRTLSSKNYWKQLESPDFVVLFLPSEHLFSSALSGDADLVDFASDNQVVIASPTLMLSLLRVVGLSWRQVELAKNAQDISKIGSELFERIGSFASHLDKMGKGMETALGSYNKAVSVLESRVLVSARKLKDLHAAPDNKSLDEPRILENSPRPVLIETPDHDEDEIKTRHA